MKKEKHIIEINNLTKDFGNNNGVFNISLKIEKGEMFGFIGTNGSGKSTTIRSILGFIKPTSGNCFVEGKESWQYSSSFIKRVGYVPGEIAFPDLPTGIDFLKNQAEFLKLKNIDYANKLIKILQLDPRANLRKMSKGMKQKTALVAALMSDPPILILDEPTNGLDPLMRINFMNVIKKEHQRGKTIFMSSQSFEELEETCDRVAFIFGGKIIAIADMNELSKRPNREFKIEFNKKTDYEDFKKSSYNITRDQKQYFQITIDIEKERINQLMNDLKSYDLKYISENKYTLEKHFKTFVNNNYIEEKYV
ncbi:MAG: ABC transporter ATP-binding protein [Bacilli bacterium]|nr:ABC transporter ATP-binding protein [Bacilli bacterium]